MKMKYKIGIITLPLKTNYGGILQAYALQKIIKRLKGDKVVFLNRRHETQFKDKLKEFVINIFYPTFNKTKKSYEVNFSEFIKGEIFPISPRLESHDQTEDYILNNNIKLIIAGSDQVFRIDYSESIYKDLFLNFRVPNLKRFSYAASFGHENWKYPDKTVEIKNYLNKFEEVSVREQSGKDICENNFSIKATVHLDPTLLLEKSDYLELINKYSSKQIILKDKYILAYILDPSFEIESQLKIIASKLNCKIIWLNQPELTHRNYKSLKNKSKTSVPFWLDAFNDADYVFTDSYHGTLFSIKFNKKFIVLGNRSRGISRFITILTEFNLMEQMIYNINELSVETLTKDINYADIEDKLEVLKMKSLDYLNKNLNI